MSLSVHAAEHTLEEEELVHLLGTRHFIFHLSCIRDFTVHFFPKFTQTRNKNQYKPLHLFRIDFLSEWADHTPHEAFFILLRLLSLIICVHVNRATVLNVSLTGMWEKLHALSKAAAVGVLIFLHRQTTFDKCKSDAKRSSRVEFQIVVLPQQDTQ